MKHIEEKEQSFDEKLQEFIRDIVEDDRRIHKILELYDYAHHDTDVMEEIENLIDQLYDQMTALKQTP